ncbi:hypothetical protein, partial [Nocardia brasiliensis]|uniref:hypothetical protein n=1 Tax=Nocardia brasiliensis TaxID=37326 RepID=UPI002456F1B6
WLSGFAVSFWVGGSAWVWGVVGGVRGGAAALWAGWPDRVPGGVVSPPVPPPPPPPPPPPRGRPPRPQLRPRAGGRRG